MVKLFQVELEHYEKIEGTTLSLDGKANRLAGLIRGHLPMAMQGLAVVPLFAGYDLAGRLGPRHRRRLPGPGLHPVHIVGPPRRLAHRRGQPALHRVGRRRRRIGLCWK